MDVIISTGSVLKILLVWNFMVHCYSSAKSEGSLYIPRNSSPRTVIVVLVPAMKGTLVRLTNMVTLDWLASKSQAWDIQNKCLLSTRSSRSFLDLSRQ